MRRIHLDTDLGGDTDDACALAMLVGLDDVELVGVTTTVDARGSRAGAARRVLDLAGATAVPVFAGAALSLTNKAVADDATADPRQWPGGVTAVRSPPGAALDALASAAEQDVTAVAIGPLTNLALLEILRPGTLSGMRLVYMGGYVEPPARGLVPWGPDMDWNTQWDTDAAELVLEAVGDLTLVPLPPTLGTWLRARVLPRLRAAGPLGVLLADQAAAHGQELDMPSLGVRWPGLPDDLLNFQYDVAACAVAAGWPGATTTERRIICERDGALLRTVERPHGRPACVVTAIDADALDEYWQLAVVRAAGAVDP